MKLFHLPHDCNGGYKYVPWNRQFTSFPYAAHCFEYVANEEQTHCIGSWHLHASYLQLAINSVGSITPLHGLNGES